MRASRSAILLVKRSQQGVLYSARNNCAKIFQILLTRWFQPDRTVIATHWI